MAKLAPAKLFTWYSKLISPALGILIYLPGKNASKLFAAGFAINSTTCAANVITTKAAVVKAIDELKPIGVVKWSSLSGASKYITFTSRP